MSKEHHKARATELFTTVKKVPQLKLLGADCLVNKNLMDNNAQTKKKKQGIGHLPQLSQA